MKHHTTPPPAPISAAGRDYLARQAERAEQLGQNLIATRLMARVRRADWYLKTKGAKA